MTRFDAIFQSTDRCDVKFTPVEAVVAIAGIATDVDTILSGVQEAKPIVASFFEGLLKGISGTLTDFDPEVCGQKVSAAHSASTCGGVYNAAHQALSDELKPYTYGISKMAMMVDYDLPEGGEEFLKELRTSLGLSDEEAEAAWQGLKQQALQA